MKSGSAVAGNGGRLHDRGDRDPVQGNRLDRAEQRSGEELVVDFVATLRGERYPNYRPSGSLRIDDQFAWWLGDPKAENSTWDPDAWPALLDALSDLINSTRALGGRSSTRSTRRRSSVTD